MRKVAAAKGYPNPTSPAQPSSIRRKRQGVNFSDAGTVFDASGFRRAHRDWLPWPWAFDARGDPIHIDSTSAVISGLHFLGLHLLRKRKSALLAGVGDDAPIAVDSVAHNLAGSRAS